MVYVSGAFSTSPHVHSSFPLTAQQKIAIIACAVLLGIAALFAIKYFLFSNKTGSSKDETDYEDLIQNKDYDAIKKAIDQGLEVNKTSHLDKALKRSDKIANLFAEKVDNPDTKVHYGRELFIVKASEKGFKATVLTLVNRGANTDVKSECSCPHQSVFHDETLIEHAIKKGWNEVVLAMVEKNTNYLKDTELLCLAIDCQKDDLAAQLIEKGIECPSRVHSLLKQSKAAMEKTKAAVAAKKIPRTIQFIIENKELHTIDFPQQTQEKRNDYLKVAVELKDCEAALHCIQQKANPNIKKSPDYGYPGFDALPLAVQLALKQDNDQLLLACINQTTFQNPYNLEDIWDFACKKNSAKCASATFTKLCDKDQAEKLSNRKIQSYITLMSEKGKKKELKGQLKKLNETKLISLIEKTYTQEDIYKLLVECGAKHTSESLTHLITQGFYESAKTCIQTTTIVLDKASKTAIQQGWTEGLREMKSKGVEFNDIALLDLAIKGNRLDVAKFLTEELGDSFTQEQKNARLEKARTVSLHQWLLDIGAKHDENSLWKSASNAFKLSNNDLFELWKAQALTYKQTGGTLTELRILHIAARLSNLEAVRLLVDQFNLDPHKLKEIKLTSGTIHANSLDRILRKSYFAHSDNVQTYRPIIEYFCKNKVMPTHYPAHQQLFESLLDALDNLSDASYQAAVLTFLIEKAEDCHKTWLENAATRNCIQSIYEKCQNEITSQKVHNFLANSESSNSKPEENLSQDNIVSSDSESDDDILEEGDPDFQRI